MAKIPDQPLIKGTIGNLIYYSVGGRQYVRSKPSKVRQPNTAKQLLARDKFRQSSKLAKALSKTAPVLGLDETGNTTKSPYHTLLGCLRKSPFKEGEEPVRWEWEKLMIRRGEAPAVELTDGYNPAEQHLKLSWNNGQPGEGTLLVTGIHMESLEVDIHRIPVEKGRAILTVSPQTAWYVCELKPETKIYISGSQFIRLIEGEERI